MTHSERRAEGGDCLADVALSGWLRRGEMGSERRWELRKAATEGLKMVVKRGNKVQV